MNINILEDELTLESYALETLFNVDKEFLFFQNEINKLELYQDYVNKFGYDERAELVFHSVHDKLGTESVKTKMSLMWTRFKNWIVKLMAWFKDIGKKFIGVHSKRISKFNKIKNKLINVEYWEAIQKKHLSFYGDTSKLASVNFNNMKYENAYKPAIERVVLSMYNKDDEAPKQEAVDILVKNFSDVINTEIELTASDAHLKFSQTVKTVAESFKKEDTLIKYLEGCVTLSDNWRKANIYHFTSESIAKVQNEQKKFEHSSNGELEFKAYRHFIRKVKYIKDLFNMYKTCIEHVQAPILSLSAS